MRLLQQKPPLAAEQSIPHILHQTWKTHDAPPQWRGFVESFAEHNPEFEHRMWSDEDARSLVAQSVPELLALYDAYPYAILRADFLRYLLLWRFGGVYADMDVAFVAPLAPFLRDGGAILASEPPAHAQSHGRTSLVSNALMASAPGHTLWRRVLDELARLGPACLSHRDVLNLTGPLMLQRVVDRHRAELSADDDPLTAVRIWPPELVNPRVNSDLTAIRAAGTVSVALAERLRAEGAFALHVWSNSWVRELAGQLESPYPAPVPGFVFFPLLDSEGYDIVNLGRRVEDLARATLERPDAVAFNTDGFLKRRLRPRWRWYRMADRSAPEGLYVREECVKAWWRLAPFARG